jgi:hypothetical protein
MAGRARQLMLVCGILWLSWLVMTLVHEAGHVAAAWAGGGTVRRVVWHPAVLSRTDVRPNPHPLVEVWAGPLVGCVVPLVIAAAAALARARFAYLTWVVAGFCLIANGAYIGVGAVARPVGDAREMIAHGMARWPMVAFGAVGVVGGFWIWHRVSPQLGFGAAPAAAAVDRRHAYVTFAVALLATALGLLFGDRG